jgi:broad specificity phosphatase PhoE
MPTLYVVRHGRVASNPVDPDDPELSAAGQSQASSVAEELRTRLPGKLPILTSPPPEALPRAEVFETAGNDIRLVARGRELKSKVS